MTVFVSKESPVLQKTLMRASLRFDSDRRIITQSSGIRGDLFFGAHSNAVPSTC